MRQGKVQGVRVFITSFAWLPVLLWAFSAQADNGWEGPIASLTWENDAPAGTDRHYTHGAQLSYFTADDSEPGWTDALPALGYEKKVRRWGFALGQEIYTPDDLEIRELIQDDRPYAAWLYGRVALQRRGESFASSIAMETFALDIGVIGPEALGEEAQNLLHHNGPRGWDNQLDTEPGFAFRYSRRHLFETFFDDHWQLHLIPNVEAAAGNVATFLGGGGTVRFGYNVPNEFEIAHGRTETKFGAYLFSGLEGRWVIHNIFLDGNTFQDSHSVDKKSLVGELRLGLGLAFKRLEVIVGHTFLTDEFKKQTTDDSYSFATLLYKF